MYIFTYPLEQNKADHLGVAESDFTDKILITATDAYGQRSIPRRASAIAPLPIAPAMTGLTTQFRAIKVEWSLAEQSNVDYVAVYKTTASPDLIERDWVLAGISRDKWYLDQNLKIGDTFYYRTKTVDLFGRESDFSDEVSSQSQFVDGVQLHTTHYRYADQLNNILRTTGEPVDQAIETEAVTWETDFRSPNTGVTENYITAQILSGLKNYDSGGSDTEVVISSRPAGDLSAGDPVIVRMKLALAAPTTHFYDYPSSAETSFDNPAGTLCCIDMYTDINQLMPLESGVHGTVVFNNFSNFEWLHNSLAYGNQEVFDFDFEPSTSTLVTRINISAAESGYNFNVGGGIYTDGDIKAAGSIEGKVTSDSGTSLPASGEKTGELFFRTDTNTLYVWSGSWQAI